MASIFNANLAFNRESFFTSTLAFVFANTKSAFILTPIIEGIKSFLREKPAGLFSLSAIASIVILPSALALPLKDTSEVILDKLLPVESKYFTPFLSIFSTEPLTA